MSRFSFKEYIFKNLLPFYFQEHDTYKVDGKGILQRFIDTCSEYLDTDIINDKDNPGLDNILDIIDVDKTPDLYLNYLWEFLGKIPYGYGVIINGKAPDFNFTKPTYDLDIDPRILLKYAISLYKIRGTEKFYDILGKFYGIYLKLVETSDGGNVGDDEVIPNHDHLVLATYTDTFHIGTLGDPDIEEEEGPSKGGRAMVAPEVDLETIATYPLSDQEIRAPYPDGDCYSCLYFILYVGINNSLYREWEEKHRLPEVKATIISIVESYLPIHCKIAKYDNGDPKIVIKKVGDFNNDFNDDYFNTQM